MASSMKGFEHLEIQLEEIKSATNNFSEENVIGHGGFGKVYKGELSHSHSTEKSMVALKRLDRKHGQGDAEFHKEVRMLSCYRHENIISLLGFSRGQDEMILVYEYASRGSLDGYLKDVNLTWTQRLKICLDAAKGLSYIHDPRETYQRLIHCDIKSANILLDENFNAKVADFGLSKIGPANQQNSILVTGALGTPGYCDPVFMETYTLTKESDVYSFGIVLFEVLSGKLCFESSNGPLKILVPMWKQSCEQKQLSGIVFQGMTEQMNPDSLETFADIAYKCLKRFREERPAMSLVVEKLQEALALQELHDLKPPKEHEEIVNAAVPPLNYRSLDELKVLLTEGYHANEGKTEAVHQTVNVIFDDPGVQELLVKLYHKEWSEGQVTEYLVATFCDYFTDVKMYIEERSFRRFVESCLEQTVIVYVDHLLSQKNYIKEETIERMRLDEEVLMDFFREYISVNKVENRLRILIELRELASAESPDTFAHVYTHILEHQPDCPPDVVERIVGLREGIPRKDAKEVVQECKEIFENSLIDGNPPRAGFVFSKLKSLNTSKITKWRKLQFQSRFLSHLTAFSVNFKP